MSRRSSLILDSVVFHIRYAFGHTYLDRCGQTLVDIEQNIPDWIAGDVMPQSGNVHNLGKGYDVKFSSDFFQFVAKRPKQSIEDIFENIDSIWRVICQNLGLSEFIRVSIRFNYLFPTKSYEDSERYIKKADIKVNIPQDIRDKGYSPKITSYIAVLEKEEMQYRVEMKGIYRAEGVDPSGVYVRDPRTLSTKQKEARLAAMINRSEYFKNPMYAVNLDVECFLDNIPEVFLPSKYIKEQNEIVQNDFYILLEKLT